MVMIGEWQILDMVIHPVAKIVPHVGRDPLGEVAIGKRQHSRDQPERQQDQSRPDKVARFATDQALVDHGADNARHDQAKSCQGQQQKQGRQCLPEIGLQKSTYAE